MKNQLTPLPRTYTDIRGERLTRMASCNVAPSFLLLIKKRTILKVFLSKPSIWLSRVQQSPIPSYKEAAYSV